MHEAPIPATPRDDARMRAEADFTRLFNLSLDLMCIAGLDGYFRRVNPSWTRVLGWSEAELLSRPVADFMHPDDRERTLQARAALARGVPVRGLENRYRCKDGSYRWLAWQSISVPGDGTVIAVARDITERRQQEQDYLVTSKLESAGVLAGGVAHDFNNLLTGLVLNLEMIALCGPTNPEQAKHLRQARDTIQLAKSLTDQLIALGGGSSAKREVCDLRRVLPGCVDLALSGSGIRAEYSVAADLWPVEIDEPQIARVIRGLLLNAREATAPGGTVRLVAENVAQPVAGDGSTPPLSGRNVRIRVIDSGIGITPEALTKVFDPYYSTKQRGAQKGMGLGLTTCRKVIQEHGGRITIDSQLQGGTTVTCHLPAWPGSDTGHVMI